MPHARKSLAGKKGRPSPEVSKPPFPAFRRPTLEEARHHGYESLQDRYVDYRRGEERNSGNEKNLDRFRAEFIELATSWQKQEESEEESPCLLYRMT